MRRDVSLEKAIMLGKCDGTRRRGRPRQRWLAGVVEATGLPLDKLKDLVRDRTGWRRLIHDVTKSRKRLDGT